MKRIICIIIILCVVGMVFSGCTSDEDKAKDLSENKITKAPNKETSNSKVQEKPTVITMYLNGTPQPGIEEVEAAINEVIEPKINVSLDLTFVDWGAYTDKMKVFDASGEPYDLAYSSSWATNIAFQMQKDVYMDLNELLDEHGQNILEVMPERYWEAVTVDGKIKAIPSLPMVGVPEGIVVHKELAEKYGFDPDTVKTLHDIEPFLEQIKNNEKENGFYPLILHNRDYIYNMVITGFDMSKYIPITDEFLMNKETNEVVSVFEIPEYSDYLAYMNTLYEKGYIRPDAATIKDTFEEAKSGKYAVITYPYCIGDGGAKLSKQFGFEVLEKQLYVAMGQTSKLINNCMVIGANSKNPEAAMKFMNVLWDMEDTWVMNTLSNGIEGVSYKVVGEEEGTKVIEFIPESGYDLHLAWEFGPYLAKWFTKEEGADFRRMNQKYMSEAVLSPYTGYIFDVDEVKTEFAATRALIENYKTSFINGMIGQDMLDELNEKLTDNNYQAIKDEVSSQIEAWLATR